MIEVYPEFSKAQKCKKKKPKVLKKIQKVIGKINYFKLKIMKEYKSNQGKNIPAG